MCILFFSANPTPLPDHYKLILVNNRDESYLRPTKECHFWENYPDTIGSMDMFPGKEGGTWLAMNKQGKIGVLLNVLQPQGIEAKDLLGRGFLVPNFLSSNQTGDQYLQELSMKAASYSSFNLVTLELNKQEIRIGHYTNLGTSTPSILPPGEYGFGNSPPETPWQKVIYGKNKFSKIIANYPTVDSSEDLLHGLLDLLSEEHCHFPDAQLQSQAKGYPVEYMKNLHCLNVKMPNLNCGTRTNIVILVDADDKVTLVERTLKTPVDIENPVWVTNRFYFALQKSG